MSGATGSERTYQPVEAQVRVAWREFAESRAVVNERHAIGLGL